MEDCWHLHRGLADAVGPCSKETKSAIAKALSYLGIRRSTNGPEKSWAPTLAISTGIFAQNAFLNAHFYEQDQAWKLVGSKNLNDDQGDNTASLADALTRVQSGRTTSDHETTQKPTQPHLNRSISIEWIAMLPRTGHVNFLRSRNWAATDLGPMSNWPYPLQLMTLKMLADPRPANLYWGPTHIAIYNEAFSVLASNRHPAMMGATAEEAMPATYPFLSQVFDKVESSGIAFSLPEIEMTVEKVEGIIEEAWYDGIFSPIRDTDGKCLGLYNSGFEITGAKVSARRSQLLHGIAAGPQSSNTSPWQHIVDVCEHSERDIPLLMVYQAQAQAQTTMSSSRSLITLEAYLGIDEKHTTSLHQLDLYQEHDSLVSAIRLAKANVTHVMIEGPELASLSSLTSNINSRGGDTPLTHVVVIPLFTTGLNAGFLVVGLNPMRPFDDAHKMFVEDIGRVANGLLAAITTIDQAKEREETLTRELTVKQKFLHRVAEIATVGIFTSSADGLLTWANSQFFALFGLPVCLDNTYNFQGLECVLEEDRTAAKAEFLACVSRQTPYYQELRLTRKWTPPGSTHQEFCWMMMSSVPNIEDGVVVDVLGCVADISHLKWAEKLQSDMAAAAKEAKLQQERFIDFTSHEMRNPLSAMLQSADDVTTVCLASKPSWENHEDLAEAFETILENARTMTFCARHQKRIIDDILTVSKLDSSMLIITPIPIDPSAVTRQVLQAFEAEMSANNIHFDFVQDKSYQALGTKQISCDPSRLTQILINLVTNAIKFTKNATERKIIVKVSVFEEPPLSQSLRGAVQWFPSVPQVNKTNGNMGKLAAHKLYLMFEVQDSGAGITDDELQLLFNRFAQGNPKTHINYGGSGLGLFISRQLAELQGGMIGASSIPNHGSTFAFYIETRMSESEAEIHRPLELRTSESRRTLSGKIRVGSRESQATSDMASPDDLAWARNHNPKTQNMPSLLFVEDNLVNQKLTTRQLQRSGCTVYVANHGREALNMIEKTRYWRANNDAGIHIDVVLMDWEMPVMDGLTCTKEIRRLEGEGQVTKHLKIIALTANARPEQMQTAMSAGMDDLLTKPFTVASLLKRIETLMQN